jgi:hypothetical protein
MSVDSENHMAFFDERLMVTLLRWAARTIGTAFLVLTAASLARSNGWAGEAPNGTPHRPSSSDHESPKSLPSFVQNLKLREELLVRMAEDQKARKHLLELIGSQRHLKDAHKQIELVKGELRDIDGRNLVRMKEIVHHFGWPGQNLVGSDGSQAAWLLVQHADSDLAFQKQCLALIAVAVEKGESPPEHMAYLTDRVRVAEKQKQIYGTQFHDVDGKQEPYPIESEADLDHRRRKVGLPPMADYRKSIEKMYRPGM